MLFHWSLPALAKKLLCSSPMPSNRRKTQQSLQKKFTDAYLHNFKKHE